MHDVISHAVNKDLHLVEVAVSKASAKPAATPPVHHIVMVDASGSMGGEIPRIRQHLKNKLPTMVNQHDLVSLGWFSGDGQCDMLFTAEQCASLTDFQSINRAIDKLTDIGMTGFMDPIRMIAKVVGDVARSHPGHVASAIFVTDGGHNGRATRAELLAAAEKASGGLASFAWVAYGHYSDINFLNSLGEKSGGSVVMAADFRHWEPVLETALQRRASGGKKIAVSCSGDVTGGIAWTITDGGDILAFSAEVGVFVVPPDTKTLWYLSPDRVGVTGMGVDRAAKEEASGKRHTTPAGTTTIGHLVGAAYAGVMLFGMRLKPKLVKPILRALGDVAMNKDYAGAFGRQRLSTFTDYAKGAAINDSLRFTGGYDPTKVPASDAFTVLDAIDVLSSDEKNRLMLDDPSFVYTAIGRGRVDAGEVVTPTEQKLLEKLRAAAQDRSVDALKALHEAEERILGTKRDALVFTKVPAPDGYSVTSITTHEDRPNIGITITYDGHVDLTARLAGVPDIAKVVPAIFKTKITRTRAIIADGLLNVQRLPVRLTEASWQKFAKAGVLPSMYVPETIVLDLSVLPIINEAMTEDVTATAIFTTAYDLLRARAEQKVFNAYKTKLAPKGHGKMGAVYPENVATWLKEQGLSDNGYNPKDTAAPSKDVRRTKEVSIALKGLSSAVKGTKVEAVLASLQEAKKPNAKPAKFTPGQKLFVSAIESCEHSLATMSGPDFAAWIDSMVDDSKTRVRRLLKIMAQMKFSISVGGVWPWDSLDTNSAKMTFAGVETECVLELSEPEIPV